MHQFRQIIRFLGDIFVTGIQLITLKLGHHVIIVICGSFEPSVDLLNIVGRMRNVLFTVVSFVEVYGTLVFGR